MHRMKSEFCLALLLALFDGSFAAAQSSRGDAVLAGYMRLISPAFLARFPQRVINVHPALLPAFPGIRVIEQALEYGAKVTGVTVHFVDEGVDTGPIILQRALEIGDAVLIVDCCLPSSWKQLPDHLRDWVKINVELTTSQQLILLATLMLTSKVRLAHNSGSLSIVSAMAWSTASSVKCWIVALASERLCSSRYCVW